MKSLLGVLAALTLVLVPSPLEAQADKALLFARLDSVHEAVTTRAIDDCKTLFKFVHNRHCDAVWDSVKVLEDSIRNLHYRNSAGVDVDSTRKARGSRWLAECYGKDENTPTCKALRNDSAEDVAGAPQKDTLKAARPSISQDGSFSVLDFRTKTLETNDVWWRFGWVATIKNQWSKPIVVTGRVQFVDHDGFAVDEAELGFLRLDAHAEQTFTGYKLINTATAPTVDSWKYDIHREQ